MHGARRLCGATAALFALVQAGPAAAQGTPSPKDLARGGRPADAALVIAAVDGMSGDPSGARALLATYVDQLAGRCAQDPLDPADLERLLALAEALALDATELTALRGCGPPGGLRRYVATFEGNGLAYAFDHCGIDPSGTWDITVGGAMSGRGRLVMAPTPGSAAGHEGSWGIAMAMAGMEIEMDGRATLTFGADGEGEFLIETAGATGTGSGGSATAAPNTKVHATLTVTPEACQPSAAPAG